MSEVGYEPRPTKSGHEAFVEYEDCNPLDYLAGWRMVEVEDDVDLVEGEQRTHGALWRDGRRFDDAVLRDLREIAKFVMPGRALQLYLLWENCD